MWVVLGQRIDNLWRCHKIKQFPFVSEPYFLLTQMTAQVRAIFNGYIKPFRHKNYMVLFNGQIYCMFLETKPLNNFYVGALHIIVISNNYHDLMLIY